MKTAVCQKILLWEKMEGGKKWAKNVPGAPVKSKALYTHPLCLFMFMCQKKEGGVCSEVLHSEARRECSWIPGAQ